MVQMVEDEGLAVEEMSPKDKKGEGTDRLSYVFERVSLWIIIVIGI